MLHSDELYCPSTNQVLPLLEQLNPWTRDRVKQLQCPYFSALSPHAINPTTLRNGILFSPQFRSHQETRMTARSNWTIDIYDLTEKSGLWTV